MLSRTNKSGLIFLNCCSLFFEDKKLSNEQDEVKLCIQGFINFGFCQFFKYNKVFVLVCSFVAIYFVTKMIKKTFKLKGCWVSCGTVFLQLRRTMRCLPSCLSTLTKRTSQVWTLLTVCCSDALSSAEALGFFFFGWEAGPASSDEIFTVFTIFSVISVLWRSKTDKIEINFRSQPKTKIDDCSSIFIFNEFTRKRFPRKEP